MNYKRFITAVFAVMVLFFAGCQKDEMSTAPETMDSEDEMLSSSNADYSADDMMLEKKYGGSTSAVFTQTNSPAGNEVVMYSRSAKGLLSFNGNFSTGGTGTGTGLGSQGAIVLEHGLLFVVNAGSNDISVFAVKKSGLILLDRTASGGTTPISLTVYKNLLYVVNSGGTANITGFNIGLDGNLTMITNSTRSLSTASPAPAQIEFSPDGNFLVVTEKATNLISTYTVNNGIADGPVSNPSAGQTPFGFAFDKRGHIIVSEAFGGAPLAGAVSSYNVNGGGSQLITGPVYNMQTAPCWVAITGNGKFAYITNTGTGNISGYRIKPDGSISLFNDGGNTASTGMGSSPIDMAISKNSQYLYALGATSNTISVFSVSQSNGVLAPVQTISVPMGSVGLAGN